MYRKLIAASALVAAVVVAVMSTAGGAAGAISKSKSTAKAASGLQATADKKVQSYEALPATSAYPDYNGTPYKPGKHTAWVVGCGSSTPACEEAAQFGVQALHAMGWSSPAVLNGENTAATQAAILERAAQQKIAGVILVGVDVNTIPAATLAAAKAGVKITCVVCDSGSRWNGKVVDVTPNWVTAGDEAAWETIALSGPHAKVAQFYDSQFTAVTQRDSGVTNTIKKNCPGCTISNIDVTANELGTPGPAPWTAFLSSHPAGTVDSVISQNDSLELVMAATDASDGRSAIKLGGWDGDAPNITALVKGKPQITWTVAHPYDYEAWTAADVLGRWTAGLKIPSGLQNMPLMIVTKANASKLASGNPQPSTYPAPGSKGSWQAVFKKTWKK